MSEDYTDEDAFPDAKSKDEIVSALNKELSAEGITVRFRELRKEGDIIKGNVQIRWEEKIAGRRIVLIDTDKEFSFQGRLRIFEQTISLPLGIRVTVYAEVFFDPPNRVCVEAKAKWPGGSVGSNPSCEKF